MRAFPDLQEAGLLEAQALNPACLSPKPEIPKSLNPSIPKSLHPEALIPKPYMEDVLWRSERTGELSESQGHLQGDPMKEPSWYPSEGALVVSILLFGVPYKSA